MRPEIPSYAIKYIRDLYAQEDSLLKDIAQTLSSGQKEMQVGPEEGKILQLIIKLANIKKVVEIGTLAGYSALWMARALPEDGKLWAIEKSLDHAKMAQKNFLKSEVKNKINLYNGDAHTVLDAIIPEGPFDMVFIDADKGGYLNYYKWAKENLKPGGIIVADNTLLFGSVYQDDKPKNISKNSWEIMKEFNETLANDDSFDSILLPTLEGLTIAIKKK